MLSNRNAILLIIVFGFILGIMNTYGTTIGIITDHYGYSLDAASLFGAVFIFGGILGSGIFGGIVEVKKTYKLNLIIICAMTAVTPLGLLFALLSDTVWLVAVCAMIVGFASIPVMPVGIDFGVEMTHPIAESIVSGLLMSAGQFVGIILTVSSSWWITHYGDAGCIYS